MKIDVYLRLCQWLFAAAGALHAARLYYGWEVRIGDWTVPMGVSVAGFIAGASMSTLAREQRRTLPRPHATLRPTEINRPR